MLGGRESEIGIQNGDSLLAIFSFLKDTIETPCSDIGMGYCCSLGAGVGDYSKVEDTQVKCGIISTLMPSLAPPWNETDRPMSSTVPLMMEVSEDLYPPQETTVTTAYGRFQSLAGHYRCAVYATQNMPTIK